MPEWMQVANFSPYYEAFKREVVEVIFCYQEHKKIVLGNFGSTHTYAHTHIPTPSAWQNFSVCVYMCV